MARPPSRWKWRGNRDELLFKSALNRPLGGGARPVLDDECPTEPLLQPIRDGRQRGSIHCQMQESALQPDWRAGFTKANLERGTAAKGGSPGWSKWSPLPPCDAGRTE